MSVALLVAGISLVGATACQTETDAPNETEVSEATAKARSALQVSTFDFLANAPAAYWHNNDGGLTWGSNGTAGTCMTASGVMENGTSYPSFLNTQPKSAANGFTHGAYTVAIPAAALHPTVTATFGFKSGASATSGLTFSLTTQVNGTWITIFSQTKTYTGALVTKTADLSAYGGQTLQLFLNVDAGANATSDWGGWTDARITADSNTPPTSCVIGGVGYASGDVNPASSCQICEPITSASAWTVRGDSCLIGGTCYTADQVDTLGCKKCDPNISQTSWSNKSSCDNTIIATTNGSWIGGSGPGTAFGGMSGADALCASEGAALGLPGTWKAALSDSGTRNYKDTIVSPANSKPVLNLQGQQLYASWDSIFTNQVWPSGTSIYSFGTSPTSLVGSAYTGTVWTGTNTSGVWATTGSNGPGFNGNNCNNWTQGGFLFTVYASKIGDFSQRKLLDNAASAGPSSACTSSRRLTCVLTPPKPPLTVENYDGTSMGAIAGKSQGDSMAYLGLPYAAPPTGNLRLAPPAKVTAWSGVRNAFSQPPPCAQKPFFPLPPSIYNGSEDCLYLNVWAPKTAGPTSNLPVFVFHPPSALMFGGTAGLQDVVGMGLFDGDRLAATQNMIVVTFQTRLAALGYLALPELSANSTSRTSTNGGGTSGNYGLLDGIQALKWIKRNISKFGGDPTHVTLAGASGGGTLAALLLSSPLSKDPADNKPYFSSAFLMSNFYEMPTMASRYTQGAAQLPTVHCESASDKVACLRSASVNDFTAVVGDFLTFIPDMLNAPISPELAWGMKVGPSIDGYVLPTQPRVAYAAGQHQKVPVIVGGTEREFNSFMVTAVAGLTHALTTGDITNMVYLATCNDYTNRATLNLGATLAAAALPLYPCSGFFYLGPTKPYAEAMTHVQYECPVRRTARALVAGPSPQPVRRYMFTHFADHIGVFQNLLGLARDIGPAHALDIAYVFNTHSTIVLGLPTYWPSQRELDLTNRYGKYIRTFAATGDPNYTGGNTWTAYNASLDNTLSLKVVKETGLSDPGPVMVNQPAASAPTLPGGTSLCDFWDNNFTLDGWK